MFDFLKKLLGTKSEKDIKNLEHRVEEINTIFNSLKSVSNDELRARSNAIKARIQDAVKPQYDQINTIKAQIESQPEMDVNTKEDLYKQIDEVEKEITKKLEEFL